MNKALSSALLVLGACAVVAGQAPAQDKRDKIVWTDGTVENDVTVTVFTLREIKYRKRGAEESRSADQVADLDVKRVRDKYRRAFADASTAQGPGNFLAQAEQLSSDPFLAQFGYVEAAQLFLRNKQYSEAFQCLELLGERCPDSGFVPMLHRVKLDYYLGQGKAKARDAQIAADKYETAAQTMGYPAGAVVEAEYYKQAVRGVAGEVDSNQLRSAMRSILQKAEASYPDVADKARLWIANTLAAENKLDEAKAEYQELVQKDHSGDDVRAGAWLGLGKVLFREGDPVNREPYLDALRAFLHVYVDTPNAPSATVSEALHMGRQAAEKWGGPDAARMGRTLRKILERDYPDSPWK